jgi:hypothetical protein
MSQAATVERLAGVWAPALSARLTELNQQLIEQLRSGAVAPAAAPGAPHLSSALAEEWRALDPAAERRLAACPYLLLDAGFSQPERWERLSAVAVMEPPAPGGYFRDRGGVALVRRALVLAWHLASSNPALARISLAMTAATAECLARSSLMDLEALAERAPAWIVPRWEQQPRVWRQLLRAARAGDTTALRQAQLRGLQLLAARVGPLRGAH